MTRPILPSAFPSLGRRSLFGLGAAGLLGPGAQAQTSSQTPPRPPTAPKGQVIIGVSQEPTKFNPLMPAIEVDQGVWWNVFSPLWNVQPDGGFTPVLAREVPGLENGGISADGLSWRIRLREGVKWHDGAPFTAEDVKFTLQLINNPDFRAGSRNGHDLVRDIQVVSPTEISWRMERAFATYPSILAWTFMVPKHILEKAGDPNNAAFNNAPIGTGPFRWGERVAGDHILLLANRDHVGEGPYLERLVFKYIPDLTVMYTQFRTGEIDHTSIQGITADHYEEARDLRDRVVLINPSASVESITPNLAHPALGDRAVREALYAAINKKAIVDTIYYGLPALTESFLPQQSWAYAADLPKQQFDPGRANRILDEAGWKRGADGVRAKDGVRLEFTNSTTAGNQLREQAQQLLIQDWKAVGAAMKINNMPAAVVWGDYFRLSKFDSVMVGVTFGVGSDPDASDRLASTSIPARGGSGRNTIQYANPAVDALLREGVTSFDRAKRRTIYAQVQKQVRDDLAILPLFQYATIEGVKKGLVGYQPNINTLSSCWNCATWFWAS
ncbi:MAG TPA: peptide ABC transporter substrate-binding protein [Acetobacteraceae bacterium]